MADVFISYASEDRELTKRLAAELSSQGYSVWWDTDLLSGDRFSENIQFELDKAKAVVVVWTSFSVQSRWVYSEATRADSASKLIPVKSSDVQLNQIPLPFGSLQTGDVNDIKPIVRKLSVLIGAPNRPMSMLPSLRQDTETTVPPRATDHVTRGDRFCSAAKHEEAILEYTAAIQLHPTYAEAYFGRGTAYRGLNQLTTSLRDLDQAIALNPLYSDAYNQRANVFAGRASHGPKEEARTRNRDCERAIADYTRAIELKCNYAYSGRGEMYLLKGDPRAVDDFTEALKQEPNNDHYYMKRAQALMALEKVQLAIGDYDEVIALGTSPAILANAYLERGMALLKLGNQVDAERDVQRALKLQPHDAGAIFALHRIKRESN